LIRDIHSALSVSTFAFCGVLPFDAMWICHRVVEKYRKGGIWYFRTKGDNNSEIDPWEVPGYWLLGVVTSIEPVEYTPEPPPTTLGSPEPLQSQDASSRRMPSQTPVEILMAGFVVSATIAAFIKLRSRKQLAMLRRARVFMPQLRLLQSKSRLRT
jgi:hypothetical protein